MLGRSAFFLDASLHETRASRAAARANKLIMRFIISGMFDYLKSLAISFPNARNIRPKIRIIPIICIT